MIRLQLPTFTDEKEKSFINIKITKNLKHPKTNINHKP